MKLRRKVFMSVMSLLMIAATFTSTTYAWFKINSSANVSGFDFEVNSGEGFWVSIDGENYYQDLTATQIKQAIVLGYDNVSYSLKEEKLIHTETNAVVSNEEIDKILTEKILLLPRTSTDGMNLKDLYGSSSLATDGSFVEFSIYFDAHSKVAEEGQSYEIYLSGQEIILNDNTKLNPTSITSDVTNVTLLADMNTMNGYKSAGQTMQVYSANAMRMSTQDTSLETPSATIYELTNEYDLGSYATDYSGEDIELQKLYSADSNAMFTYYNNLRSSSPLQKMEYEKMPQAIRTIDSVDDLPTVTTVKSGSTAKLVTFRFWLEGWDADCFDGLDKSINVKLSFTSKRVIN